MNPAEGATIIGPQTKVRGDISGTENLLIEGEVQGTITLPGGRVTIGERGRVRARIFAQEIVVSGRVQGDLLATDAIFLRSTAMVLGNVVSPRFVVEQDALLRGTVDPVKAVEPEPPTGTMEETAQSEAHSQEMLFPGEVAGASRMPAGLAAAERHVQDTASGSPDESAPKDGAATGLDL